MKKQLAKLGLAALLATGLTGCSTKKPDIIIKRVRSTSAGHNPNGTMTIQYITTHQYFINGKRVSDRKFIRKYPGLYRPIFILEIEREMYNDYFLGERDLNSKDNEAI